MGKVDVFSLVTPELPSLVTFIPAFISVQTADAHWLADAVHTFRRWRMCVWNGQVETDAPSCFGLTIRTETARVPAR